MKRINIAAVVTIICCPFTVSFAGGTTGPCTPPEGDFDISGAAEKDGTFYVCVTKDVELTAKSLKDKDCNCGSGVQDTIDTAEGIKWEVAFGTLAGSDIGSPKTWTAPDEPTSGMTIAMTANDGGASPATDDGGFTQVKSRTVTSTVPDHGIQNYIAPPFTCAIAGKVGVVRAIKDTVEMCGVTGIKFTGLGYAESQNPSPYFDTCGISPVYNGGVTSIDSNNQNTKADYIAVCSYSNVGFPPGCISTWALVWYTINPNTGSTYETFNRFYSFANQATTVVNAGGLTDTQTIPPCP